MRQRLRNRIQVIREHAPDPPFEIVSEYFGSAFNEVCSLRRPVLLLRRRTIFIFNCPKSEPSSPQFAGRLNLNDRGQLNATGSCSNVPFSDRAADQKELVEDRKQVSTRRTSLLAPCRTAPKPPPAMASEPGPPAIWLSSATLVCSRRRTLIFKNAISCSFPAVMPGRGAGGAV